MDPIFAALTLGGALAGSHVYTRWRARSWKGIAADCGLHAVRVSGWAWRLKLQGRMGRLKVQIAVSLRNANGVQVIVEIPGPQGFSEVSLRRENQVPWKTRDIEVGSEDFDQTFFVGGPVRLVRALLDAPTRRLLLRANDEVAGLGSRLEIADGKLLAVTPDRHLPYALPLLLDAATRLAQDLDVGRRLAQNATREPEAGVRLQNLSLLARELPDNQEALKVLRAACSDKDPQVRLRAAMALGAEGHSVLVDLAKSPLSGAAGTQAVSILGSHLPFKSMKALFLNALSLGNFNMACDCLEVLSRTGGTEAVDVLVKVIEKEQGELELTVFAAQALGRIGDPAAEATLIQALQSEHKSLRVAAAHALGRVGSVTAVPLLRETAERFPRDSDLDRAARQAIAEIQSRLQGASPGQLSLAGAQAGQLSLAQAESGQLSLATDPAGQLSISGAEETPEEA